MSDDFFDMLRAGREPTWLRCECGELSTRVPCLRCVGERELRAAAREELQAAEDALPRRYRWARLEAPELAERVKSQKPLEEVAKYVLASHRAAFWGPSGSGKTSFAVACLRETLPRGVFVSAVQLATARIQHSAGDGEAAIVERALRAPLLLIDELGGEARTATSAVRDVIFRRYDADRPTWVTTGMRQQQIVEMYGDGILRRLTEDACNVVFGGGKP